MRLEPKECRLQALTCERLAQRSTSPIVKGAYADLAKNWLKVADEIQATNNAANKGHRTRRLGQIELLAQLRNDAIHPLSAFLVDSRSCPEE
jgi:hypothetical protein